MSTESDVEVSSNNLLTSLQNYEAEAVNKIPREENATY